MATVFHARLYGRFIETQQPQENETSQNESGLQFSLSGSLKNRVNIKVPIQFRRKRQAQHH